MKILARLFLVVWVVSWTANYSTMGSCPSTDGEIAIKVDPYTGQLGSDAVVSNTADLKYCSHAEPMKKRFDSKEEAQTFIDGCPKGTCADVYLESADE